MANNLYYKDTTVKLSVVIKLDDGTETDPTGLTFVMEEPDGELTTVNYLEPESNGTGIIHKTEEGRYYIEWPSTKVGQYTFKFQATGSMGCAVKGTYSIRDTNP